MTGVVLGSQGTGVLQRHTPGTGVAAPSGFQAEVLGVSEPWDTDNSTTITVPYPPGLEKNNRLWLIEIGSNAPPPDQPGWKTHFSWDHGGGTNGKLLSRVANGLESGNFTTPNAHGFNMKGGLIATTAATFRQGSKKDTSGQDIVTSNQVTAAPGSLVLTIATTPSNSTLGPADTDADELVNVQDVSPFAQQILAKEYPDGGLTDVVTTRFNDTLAVQRGIVTIELGHTFYSDTWTFNMSPGVSFSAYDMVDYSAFMAPTLGDTLIFARGGSGRSFSGIPGLLGGEVIASRKLPTGKKLWFPVGGSNSSSYATGMWPGGGFGRSGTAFTQAGGGAGYTGILLGGDHPGGSPIVIAGGSGGDPNGTQAGNNGAAGGFAGTADAALPNVTGSSGRGGSTIGGFGGVNPPAGAGWARQGGNSDGSGSASGGGGGYFGGAGGASGGATKEGGGGSSFADPQCTGVTFQLAASTTEFGEISLTTDLALPFAAKHQIDAGAAACWPMTDPIGQSLRDATGNANHTARTSTNYPGAVRADYLGPDGWPYWTRFTEGNPLSFSNSDGVQQAPGTFAPPTFDSGHTGWGQEMFVCRPEGTSRPSSSVAACGWSDGSGSDWTTITGVRMSSADNADIIFGPGVSVSGLNLFNTTDVWHHIYIRVRADNVSEIYLNGLLVASGTSNYTQGAGGFFPNAGVYSPGPSESIVTSPAAIANVAVYETDIILTGDHLDQSMLHFGLTPSQYAEALLALGADALFQFNGRETEGSSSRLPYNDELATHSPDAYFDDFAII